MLLLKTFWGTYQLNNALRIDIFKENNKKVWTVFLSIDSYKHVLHAFEAESDANIFTKEMTEQIYDIMYESTKTDHLEKNLDRLCTSALSAVERLGVR